MTLIDQIRDLIAEGETQRSLDELYKYVKESNADVIDNLVMLRSRMQNLQRSINNGTMDDQTAALERAKINEAILKLLPQLTPEYLAEAGKRKETLQRPAGAPSPAATAPETPARDMKKMYLIGGGALLVVILLIAMLSGGGDSEEDQQPIVDDSTTETLATDASPENMAQPTTPQEGFEQQEQQTNPAEEDLSAEWRSSNGSTTFSTQDGTNWFEMENGEVRFRFKMTDETSEYVEIYDASRQMTLRIFDNNVKFRQAGDAQWNLLANGGWSN